MAGTLETIFQIRFRVYMRHSAAMREMNVFINSVWTRNYHVHLHLSPNSPRLMFVDGATQNTSYLILSDRILSHLILSYLERLCANWAVLMLAFIRFDARKPKFGRKKFWLIDWYFISKKWILLSQLHLLFMARTLSDVTLLLNICQYLRFALDDQSSMLLIFLTSARKRWNTWVQYLVE